MGATVVARSEEATALGLWEVVSSLPRLLGVMHRLRRDLVARPPTAVLTVDSPDLSLRIGAFARSQGLSVVHWVAPQVWAWRPGRARRLARSADTVLCLLPFEPPLLSPHVRAVFTGHPAAALQPGRSIRPGSPTFGLVPGSRRGEVRRHWPVLQEVARRLRARHPTAGFVVPRAPSVAKEALSGVEATFVDTMGDLVGADAAVVASGTATVELAALRVPMVVIYRVHPFTYAIARRLVRVPHLALPNLIAGRQIIPEFVQDFRPEALAARVDDVRGTTQVPPSVLEALAGADAVKRAADELAPYLFGQPSPLAGRA